MEVREEKQGCSAPAIKACDCCTPVTGSDAQLMLRLAAEVAAYEREAEIRAEIFTSDDPIGDPVYDDDLYNSKTREAHKKASQRQRNRILDPGGHKLHNSKRRRRRNAKHVEDDRQRYAEQLAAQTGADVDTVRAEQDAKRRAREEKRAIKLFFMDFGYSDRGARKLISRMTDHEKAKTLTESGCARHLHAIREAVNRSKPERVGVPQQFAPALPARDPRHRRSNNPQICDTIARYRDIDGQAVREQLARDTQAFLDAGGSVTVEPDWYPSNPKDYIVVGGKKHIKSVMWGYVPHNARTGREYSGDD